MNRLAQILAVALVIGLVSAPSAFGKSLQPSLPPDARSAPGAQSTSQPSDTSTIAVTSGLGVLLVGSALYPLSRRRREPALR